ncbi:MAG: ABC transporter ATP-binding protein, partial [Sulfurovum sp.]|nr:ABC transporter ATP-binding protein [Sulfurovum sp.]
RALANEPQIILADEPTAALDSARSVSVVEMLKKIAQEQGVAVIMVTHDETVLPYCDKIMEIVDKKVVMKESFGDVKII